MKDSDLKYSDFLNKKNFIDLQILELAQKGTLNIDIIFLDP